MGQAIIKLYYFPVPEFPPGEVGITAECLLRVKWSDQGSVMEYGQISSGIFICVNRKGGVLTDG